MQVDLKISGMSCEHCARSIERLLNDVDGVRSSVVSLPDDAKVIYDESKVSIEDIKKAINNSEIYKVL